MKRFAFGSLMTHVALGSALIGLLPQQPAAGVTIDVVPVGNPGNSADDTGFGTVNASYYIGRYEVTIGQYVEFLNAVAKTDTNGLYTSGMSTDRNVAGITRTGSSGSYVYAATGPDGTAYGQSAANRPITFVNWFNAARFANWMSNGQPTGAQNATTTEDGAYTLTGATATVAVNGINDNTGAAPLYALPTQDQWYKAAFYDPTLGGSGGYYNFATRSDTTPGNVVGPDFNQANHYVTGTGYSLTQSTTLGSVQNYLTDVGAYAGSASAYGTFDQSGNTAEWTDPGPGQTSAFLRGGAWDLASTGNQFNVSEPIGTANYLTGFRLVAAVPEPSGWVLALSAVGAGGWGIRRRFHRREVRPPSGASS